MGAAWEALQVTGLWLVWVSWPKDVNSSWSSPILKNQFVPLCSKIAGKNCLPKWNRDKKGSERGDSQIVDKYMKFSTLCPLGTSALHMDGRVIKEVPKVKGISRVPISFLFQGVPP